MEWLQQNWYLAIPWVLGIGGWLFERRRPTRAGRPGVIGFLVGFLIGCVIVLAIDLTQPT